MNLKATSALPRASSTSDRPPAALPRRSGIPSQFEPLRTNPNPLEPKVPLAQSEPLQPSTFNQPAPARRLSRANLNQIPCTPTLARCHGSSPPRVLHLRPPSSILNPQSKIKNALGTLPGTVWDG